MEKGCTLPCNCPDFIHHLHMTLKAKLRQLKRCMGLACHQTVVDWAVRAVSIRMKDSIDNESPCFSELLSQFRRLQPASTASTVGCKAESAMARGLGCQVTQHLQPILGTNEYGVSTESQWQGHRRKCQNQNFKILHLLQQVKKFTAMHIPGLQSTLSPLQRI